jgi:hypothetical protein
MPNSYWQKGGNFHPFALNHLICADLLKIRSRGKFLTLIRAAGGVYDFQNFKQV